MRNRYSEPETLRGDERTAVRTLVTKSWRPGLMSVYPSHVKATYRPLFPIHYRMRRRDRDGLCVPGVLKGASAKRGLAVLGGRVADHVVHI